MFAAQPLAWLSPMITILRMFLRFMLHFLPLFLLNFLVVVSGLCKVLTLGIVSLTQIAERAESAGTVFAILAKLKVLP